MFLVTVASCRSYMYEEPSKELGNEECCRLSLRFDFRACFFNLQLDHAYMLSGVGFDSISRKLPVK